MERVVYCPSEKNLDEAKTIAKQVLLPIVIGESERISGLGFDKSAVSVIEIPRVRRFEVGSANVLLGMHQFVFVTDEFCRNEIGLYSVKNKNSEAFKMYTEKYAVKWCFIPVNKGLNIAEVFFDNEKVASLEYYVH